MVKTSTRRHEEFWTSVFADNTKTHHQCLVCQIPNGEHRTGQIMKSVASCLPEDCTKKITNYSTRKTVVGKLEAGQPRHKIIQVTGHARESSLDDYDEITEVERRQLCYTGSRRHLLSIAFKPAHLRLQLPTAWNLLSRLIHFQNA